jgi:zinc protease
MRNLVFRYLLLLSVMGQPCLASDTPEMVDDLLPSGMRIITMENPGSQTVSVNVFIAAGSLDEGPETTGLAHFYEHMFFRGTPTLSGLAFKKAIEDKGGITNATTAKDMTHYFISLPSEQAEAGLRLLADALIRPELAQEGIDIERDVVLEEYRIGENNPGRLATEGLYRLAYGEHPYGLSTIGTKEQIKTYNRSDFVKWRNRHYGPTRCTIVVVGDINVEKMAQKAKFLFSGFKGTELQKRQLVEPPDPPAEPVFGEGSGPVASTVLMLGFPAPSAHDKTDVYGMDVLSFILGQGKNSLLHRELVKEREIASSVDVAYLTPRQRGLMIVSVVGEPKKTGELKKEVIAVIASMKDGKFTDVDMRRAKAHLLQSFLQGNETNSGKADTIGFYSALGVPGFWKSYPQEIEAVTREDVIATAEKYLNGGYWGYILNPNRGRR